ncbi:hypothetical protein [Methylorubrum extorquens]
MRPAPDGRLRLLRPTDRLLAWGRAVLSSYYDVLQDLYPDPGYGLAVAPDPAFHLARRRVSIEVFGVIACFRHGPALGAMLSMTGMRRPPRWPPPA